MFIIFFFLWENCLARRDAPTCMLAKYLGHSLESLKCSLTSPKMLAYKRPCSLRLSRCCACMIVQSSPVAHQYRPKGRDWRLDPVLGSTEACHVSLVFLRPEIICRAERATSKHANRPGSNEVFGVAQEISGGCSLFVCVLGGWRMWSACNLCSFVFERVLE